MCDILTLTYEQVKPVENPEGPGIWGRNQREVQITAQNSEPTAESAVRLVAVHPHVCLWTDRRAGSFGEVNAMNDRKNARLSYFCAKTSRVWKLTRAHAFVRPYYKKLQLIVDEERLGQHGEVSQQAAE
jgi:hypothetical protein